MSDNIVSTSIPTFAVAGGRLFSSFVYHSIYVFRFDLLHNPQNALKNTAHMWFQTFGASFTGNLSVWEICVC